MAGAASYLLCFASGTLLKKATDYAIRVLLNLSHLKYPSINEDFKYVPMNQWTWTPWKGNFQFCEPYIILN